MPIGSRLLPAPNASAGGRELVAMVGSSLLILKLFRTLALSQHTTKK